MIGDACVKAQMKKTSRIKAICRSNYVVSLPALPSMTSGDITFCWGELLRRAGPCSPSEVAQRQSSTAGRRNCRWPPVAISSSLKSRQQPRCKEWAVITCEICSLRYSTGSKRQTTSRRPKRLSNVSSINIGFLFTTKLRQRVMQSLIKHFLIAQVAPFRAVPPNR